MDEQDLKQEFVYEGTGRDFINLLAAIDNDEYKRFTNGEIRWADLWPRPQAALSSDGMPITANYMGQKEVTFVDPIDRKKRTRHEEVLGLSFRLDRLVGEQTRIVACCHLQSFAPLYHKLLGLFGVLQEATPIPTTEVLTRTQVKIANLVADGLTQGEIAGELIMSVETVKTHKRLIRERLGIGKGENLRAILKQEGYGTEG